MKFRKLRVDGEGFRGANGRGDILMNATRLQHIDEEMLLTSCPSLAPMVAPMDLLGLVH